MTEAIQAAIDSAGAYIAFAFVLLGLFSSLMLTVLFLGLAVRAGWRRLARHSWKDAVLSAERKALR